MKALIRKIAREMAGWPVIGRLVKIGVAVIRLPEFRASTEQAMQQPVASTPVPVNDSYRVFETEQLPSLLQAVSEVNHRQLIEANGQNNMVRSVPVSLRKMMREIVQLREQNQRLQADMDVRIDAATAQVAAELRELIERTRSDALTQVRALEEASAQQAAAAAVQASAAMTSASTAMTEAKSAAAEAKSATAEANAAKAQTGTAIAQATGLAESVQYLLGRVEFVRRELMFEMRYGATTPGTEGEKLSATSEILEPAKVEQARQGAGLRLNLGCGHVPLPGYLNVDRRALPGVDVVAEVDQLPFAKGEVAEICSAHLLEHFPLEQLRRELLPYWVSLLRADGVFRAIVPDGANMARAFASKEYSFENLRQVTFGGQDYDGDFHYNMFSTETLGELLREAGFTRIDVVAENRENGGCKEFEIVAAR